MQGRGENTKAIYSMKYGISEKQQENWYGLSKVTKKESRRWGQRSRGNIMARLDCEFSRNPLGLHLGSGGGNMIS